MLLLDDARPAAAAAAPAFAVYAEEQLVVRSGARVRRGDVGVAVGTPGRPAVEITGATVGGGVYGDSVYLGPGAEVGAVFANQLQEERATHGAVSGFPPGLPRLAVAPRVKVGLHAMVVPARGRATLRGDGTRVVVEPGATLFLPGGRFAIEALVLGAGSRLQARRPSLLLIGRTLEMGPDSTLGPTAAGGKLNLTVVVAGSDEPGAAAAVVGKRAEVRALLRVPNGTLRLGSGVQAWGEYHGRRVEIGQRAVVRRYPSPGTPAQDLQCMLPHCTVGPAPALKVQCNLVPVPGLVCEDGSACTKPDVCDAAGECISGPPVQADGSGSNPCVRDDCDPAAGIYEPFGTLCGSKQCREPTTCDGAGHCSTYGAPLPADTPCDDGIPNNGADFCNGSGSCSGQLGPYDCKANPCSAEPGSPPDLDCWLDAHPAMKGAIRFKASPGYYFQWTPAQKQQLKNALVDAWQWHASGMTNFQGTPIPEPPPNSLTLADDDGAITGFADSVAWPLYLAHVAHGLAVEIGKWVPWSLCDYPPKLIHAVLSDQGPFSVVKANDSTPAHPTFTFAFLSKNGLIGTDRKDTIARLVDWGRHLHHHLGGGSAKNFEAHWQYRGEPPVSRVIQGTVNTFNENIASLGPHNWTAGCWGTTAFLREVLRTVNIPVSHIEKCGHAQPYFPSDGLYLSHGDDPYSGFDELDAPAPALGAMVLDQATYTSWFAGSPEATTCPNVGRRPAELALELLPRHLVSDYCLDVAQQLDHASGRVFAWFKYHNYSLQDLEAGQLWQRLGKRAAELGLC